MSPNPEKILVLVRHAHRDTTSRKADNGLSNKGQKQALEIKKELASKFMNEAPLLVSSPKLRCIETLEPLAEALGKKVKSNDLLDEAAPDESTSELIGRIQEFLDWWKTKAPKVTVACSHGDWLPEAYGLLTGKQMDLTKGSWALLALYSGKVHRQESSANRDH